MVLVDTSIWIEHFRAGDVHLAMLLGEGQVLTHPFVIGELACGNLRNRRQILDYLACLPQVPLASSEEVLFFIEQHQIMGKGIGYIDVSLLASTVLATCRLWTRDLRLKKIAVNLNIAYKAG